MSVNVHRHDRSCSWRNFLLNLAYIHAPGPRLAIYKNRNPVIVENGQSAGDDGKCGNDNFIARPYPKAGNRQLERGRTIAYRDPKPPAAVRWPSLLKLVDKPPCRGNPVGPHAFSDVCQILLVQQWLIDRDHSDSCCTACQETGQRERFLTCGCAALRIFPFPLTRYKAPA